MGLLLNDELLGKCLRKQAYRTMGAAKARLKEMRGGGRCVDPKRLRVYLCDYCDEYHIGHIAK